MLLFTRLVRGLLYLNIVGASATAGSCKPCLNMRAIDTAPLQIHRQTSISSSPDPTTLIRYDTSPETLPPIESQSSSVGSGQERSPQPTSMDDYPPMKVQSASDIALPSQPPTTLATTLNGVPAEPQSYSAFGILPSAPVLGLPSGGSTGDSSRNENVLSSSLPTVVPKPPSADTDVESQSPAGLDGLMEAMEQVASTADLSSTVSILSNPIMSAPLSSEPSQNALSVLLSALPSDLASSLEVGYSVLTHELIATTEVNTAEPTSIPPQAFTTGQSDISTSESRPASTDSRPTERPSSRYTEHPLYPSTDRPSSQPSSRPTSHPTTHPTSRPPKPPTSIQSTLTTLPSATSSSQPSTTSTPIPANNTTEEASSEPTITPQRQQTNGSIAGVATGAAAGAVLLTLAIFFFLRRRQRKRLAATPDPSQPYPEVAWLYDPARSPARSLSPSPAPPTDAAGAQPGTTRALARSSSLMAPEVVVAPEGRALLAPERAAMRESSPADGARARSASPSGVAR